MRSLTFALLLLPVTLMAQKGAVLGKLGQSLSAATIRAAASDSSRAYYQVKPYQYLVITSSRSANWYRVLLSNGAWGYVRTDRVASLPYEVSAPSRASSRATMPASRTGSALAQYATRYVGTPYVWGGNDPNNGIDCSGFVKSMFGQIGLSLPRTAAEQVRVGQPVTRLESLQPGDRLYFWSSKRNKVGHTGIYMGNGWFVHSSMGKGVNTDHLARGNWLKILVAARR